MIQPVKDIKPTIANVTLNPKNSAMVAPIAAVIAVPIPKNVEYKLHSKLSCFLSRCVLHRPSQVGYTKPLPIPKIICAM